VQLEKASKKRRGPRRSLAAVTNDDTWVARALEVFATLDGDVPASKPSSPMKLRERTTHAPSSANGSDALAKQSLKQTRSRARQSPPLRSSAEDATGHPDSSTGKDVPTAGKRMPRVVLKLGPAPTSA
jgi:histone deacetylase HOS3